VLIWILQGNTGLKKKKKMGVDLFAKFYMFLNLLSQIFVFANKHRTPSTRNKILAKNKWSTVLSILYHHDQYVHGNMVKKKKNRISEMLGYAEFSK
jgi:hypothetical protein